MHTPLRRVLLALLLATGGSAAARDAAYEAAYDGVIEEVIALFDEVDVLAFGEHHGSLLNAEFRTRLVRHPEFGRKVDVIVIESANAHHQGILDRYISGREVPRAELVKVWRDTGSTVWDSPIYEAFLEAVREANRALPPEHRIRVLAGDVATDWEKIEAGRDLVAHMDRGDFPLHIVDCDVLREGLKALLVYGSGHLYHHYWGSFVATLDLDYPGRIRVLETTPWVEESMQRLRQAFGLGAEPRLLEIADTPLAGWNLFDAVYGQSFGEEPTLGEAVDGVIYLGEVTDTIVEAAPGVLEDPAYVAERERRMQLRLEAGRLFQHGDVEGYREWSEYSCPD